ncbi:stage VI sporulation protein F [Bacillaceae bacterium S4-13-58]
MDDFSKKIEKKTGVKMDELMQVAQSIKGSDLQDEKSIRRLVRKISKLAGKKVSKEKEDRIVDTLVNNKKKINSNTISKMLK